ncbi:MAG: GNAT family N-acyltransferase [Paracoccaceae bacterium]
MGTCSLLDSESQMISLKRGRYVAEQAHSARQITEAQELRGLCFGVAQEDSDGFDDVCTHILIRCLITSQLVCCFRLLPVTGPEIAQSYSAQFYELSALEVFEGKMVEIGRFCVHPEFRDPDILRIAWGAMTAYVDRHDVRLLFGCSSFTGTETAEYLDAFATLKARYLAPKRWLPRVKAPNVFQFSARMQDKPDCKKAMLQMPPLLKTYLMMGGWVSDHAVVDQKMNTLHVFTGLEVGAIPPARKRLLRAVAG